MLGNLFELGLVNTQIKISMLYLKHLSSEIVIVSWFIFFIYFIGYKKWLTKRNIILISIVPFFIMLSVFTNQYHNLFFKSINLLNYRSAVVLSTEGGPLFWLDLAYTIILITIAAGLITSVLLKSYHIYKWQISVFLVINIIILAVALIDKISINIFPYLSKTPVVFVLGMTVLILTLSKSKISEVLPTAREFVLDSMEDGILIIDNDSNILDLNLFMKRIMNPLSKKCIGRPVKELLPAINDIMEKPNNGRELEISKNKKTRFFDVKISDLLNSREAKIGEVIVLRDITTRKTNEDKIKYLSFHDYLTDIYNRAFFEEELKRLDVKRRLPISIVLADINGLRIINDTFGKEVGDKVLIKLSKILKNCFRSEDILARLSGDTFGAILPSTSMKSTLKIVKRIKDTCKKSKSKIGFTISMGFSTKTKESQSINEVLKEADSNMNKHKLLERKSFHGSIVSSLERALLERDYETEEHVTRMKEYSIILGRELKLSENQLDELKLLATLHDIGKISIPDNIIFKPGKLNVMEWKIVKKHPEIGHRIAKTTPELSTIADGILTHHEWWDGKGYPRGLKEFEVSIISRIVSIVDAYDAMTSDRPYRKALSKKTAMKELKRCSGTQFDPSLVEAFVKLLKTNKI
jgi:diguanylate cyclase (GGDEF)-like protein